MAVRGVSSFRTSVFSMWGLGDVVLMMRLACLQTHRDPGILRETLLLALLRLAFWVCTLPPVYG